MSLINKLRYSRWFSVLVRKPFKVLSKTLDLVSRQIRKKVKVNSGAIHYYGIQLRFPTNVGRGVLSNIYWKGESGFEEATGKVLMEMFKRSSVFFDIGSNFGFYSVLAKKVNAQIQVVAFEPLASMVRQNHDFRKANDVEYTVLSKGLSDRNSVEELFVPEMPDTEKEISSASFDKDFFFNKKFEHTSVTIECITLDSFAEEYAHAGELTNLCMKVDVEGYELSVLKGAQKVLRSFRPLVVCEVDPKNAAPLFEYFRSLEFEIFHVQPLGLVKFSMNDFLSDFKKHRDFLITPREKLKDHHRNFYAHRQFATVLN